MGEQPARRIQPPVNGTDERLDLLIDEIRGLRADLKAQSPTPEGQVELREPAREQQGRRS
jgi:hypothetical protein